jgi:putative transposase
MWLYHKFTLSYRDIEELLAAISIAVSYENNRSELSHRPGREQERQMRKFKSQGQAQRFLSYHGVVNNLFWLGRHSMDASNYRVFRDRTLVEWGRASCVQNLA